MSIRAPGDAFERQADLIARELASPRSATPLSPTVAALDRTRLPAASLRVPGSRGEPLPARLRHPLEERLHARLGAVRIHRDAAADEAARAHRAKALAAGSHIYFSSGAFAPGTRGGDELIAHEVVHVLQQTAVKTSGGALAATDNENGAGAAQRVPLGLASSTTIPTRQEIRDRHRAAVGERLAEGATGGGVSIDLEAVPEDRQLARLIGRFDRYVSDGLDPAELFEIEILRPAEMSSREALLTGPTRRIPALDWRAKSFAYDVLKQAGRWRAAATILKDITSIDDLRTTFYSSETYEDYVATFATEAAQQAQELFDDDPFFEDFQERAFRIPLAVYLFGATRFMQPVGGLETAKAEALEARLAPPGFVRPEPYFATIEALWQTSEFMVSKIGQLAREVMATSSGTSAEATPIQRLDVAARFASWALESPERDGLEDRPLVVRRFIRAFKAAWAAQAEIAMEGWREVAETADLAASALTGESTDEGPRVALETVRGFGRRSEFRDLQARITPLFERLLGLTPDGEIPSHTSYAGTHAELRAALLHEARNRFEIPMIRALRRRTDLRAQQSWLWGLVNIFQLIRVLDMYDSAADLAYEQDVRLRPEVPADLMNVPDHRIRHRITVAGTLHRIAELLGWTALEELALQSVAGTLPDQTHGFIALLSDWTPTPDAPFGRFMREHPSDRPIRGMEPLTPRHVVQFFTALFQRELADRVDALLRADRAAGGFGEGSSIMRRALIDAREDVAVPVRYHVAETYVILPPGQENQYGPLLDAHPKTVAFRAGLSGISVNPIGPRPGTPAFFWQIPRVEELVQRLRSIAGVDRLIEAYYRARHSLDPRIEERSADSIRRTPIWEWIGLFANAVADRETRERFPELALSTETAAGLADVGPGFTREADAAQRRLVASAAAATEFERGVRERRIRAWLAAFNPRALSSDRAEGTLPVAAEDAPLVSQIPARVMTEITDFASGVYPREGGLELAQTVALVLEIADVLPRLIGVEAGETIPSDARAVRYEIQEAFFPLLILVRNYLSNRANRERVLAILRPADGWIEEREVRLYALEAAFRQIQTEAQTETGFRGVRAEGEFYVQPADGGARIEAGSAPFQIAGVPYKIMDVLPRVGGPRFYDEFVYHPPYGELASRLYLDGTLVRRGADVLVPGLDLGAVQLLDVQYGRPRASRTVTAAPDDDFFLTQLSGAISLQGVVSSLETLNDILETSAEIGIAIFETVGPGAVVTGVRMFMLLMEFIEGGEMTDLIELIVNDPLEVLQEAVSHVWELFEPERILEILLFGDVPARLAQLQAGSTRRASPRPIARTRSAKLRRIVRRLYEFGRGMAGALARGQMRVARKVEIAQMTVLRTRFLPSILRFIADNYSTLHTIAAGSTEFLTWFAENLGEVGDVAASLAPDQIEDTLNRAMRGLADNLVAMVNGMQEFSVPAEILPVSDILDIIIDIAVRRLGARARLGATVTLAVLEAAGLKEPLLQAIGRRLPSAFNPNTYYQRYILGREVSAGSAPAPAGVEAGGLEGMLKTARREVLTRLRDLIEGAGFIPPAVAAQFAGMDVEGRNFHINVVGNDFETEAEEEEWPGGEDGDDTEETEGYGAVGELEPRGPTVVSGGAPLPGELRSDAESRFGHDFAHVRMHDGAEGARTAARFGAEAVTSGSHVFLGGGVSPSTDGGSHVLRHELTHVLQQTGPRPLGDDHDSRPVTGAPGGGLRLDASREAAADRVASEVSSGPARAPVATGGAGARGIQPMISDATVVNTLNMLTSSADIHADSEEIDATGTGMGGGYLTAPVRQQINGTWEQFSRAMRSHRTAVPAFRGELDHIESYLLRSGTGASMAADIEQALEDIALRSASLHTPHATGGAPATPEQRLNVPEFKAGLERFILGRTGILLDITFGDRDASAPHAVLTITQIEVKYVHLPDVAPHQRTLRRPLTEFVTAARATPGGAEFSEARWRRGVLAYLGDRGVGANVWQSSDYQLRTGIRDDVRARLAAGGPETLEASDLPTAHEYVNPDFMSPRSRELGQIGLRIGTFGQSLRAEREGAARGHKLQEGVERESHHTTQYLLLEFFSGKHDDPAFKHAADHADLYPGMVADSPRVIEMGRGGGTPAITLGPNMVGAGTSQRGPGMPAILIAAATHRARGVHITREVDDVPGGSETQSQTLRRWYETKVDQLLPELEGPLGGGSAVARRPFSAYEKGSADDLRHYVNTPPAGQSVDTHRDNIRDALVAGMRHSYRIMRSQMQEGLRRALQTVEREYYEELAGETHAPDGVMDPDYVLSSDDLTAVARRAEENNQRIMETTHHWDT